MYEMQNLFGYTVSRYFRKWRNRLHRLSQLRKMLQQHRKALTSYYLRNAE